MGRMGVARSGGTTVGGLFELAPLGPYLGPLGLIHVRAGLARPRCLLLNYEKFVTWVAVMTDDTAPAAAWLRELCGPSGFERSYCDNQEGSGDCVLRVAECRRGLYGPFRRLAGPAPLDVTLLSHSVDTR
jgi:hypothetical protein